MRSRKTVNQYLSSDQDIEEQIIHEISTMQNQTRAVNIRHIKKPTKHMLTIGISYEESLNIEAD